MVKKRLPVVREALLTGGAMEQPRAQSRLQSGDRLANRRPRQVEPRRCNRKVTGLGSLDEDGNVVERVRHFLLRRTQETKHAMTYRHWCSRSYDSLPRIDRKPS